MVYHRNIIYIKKKTNKTIIYIYIYILILGLAGARLEGFQGSRSRHRVGRVGRVGRRVDSARRERERPTSGITTLRSPSL